MMMMMMMCLKYRAHNFFGLEKLFFIFIFSKEKELTKGRINEIVDELHKGTSTNEQRKEKYFAARKILRLSNVEECEQRRFFVYNFRKRVFHPILLISFHFILLNGSEKGRKKEILSCVPHGWREED